MDIFEKVKEASVNFEKKSALIKRNQRETEEILDNIEERQKERSKAIQNLLESENEED